MNSNDRANLALIVLVIAGCICSFVGYQLYSVLTWEHVSFSIGIAKLVLVAIATVFVVGVILALVTNLVPQIHYNISLIEFVTWMTVFSLVISPVMGFIGWNKANQQRLLRNELWHGWEVSVEPVYTECYRDGPCKHEYPCDSYQDCHNECDSDGKNCHQVCVTKWRDCPFCTHEVDYVVHTTLGDFVIDDNVFTENPLAWRPSDGKGIPTNVQRGPSQFWKDAEQRINSGNPGPVTKEMQYENPLLASDLTTLKNYSAEIDQFMSLGLIPSPVNQVYDHYQVDEVEFVGFTPINERDWQYWLHRLNAPFGDDLQGDLRVVIVNNEYAEANPIAYAIALKFNWQDELMWGDNLASKNTFILILFTKDNQTISSATAITGMPLGNEYLIERVNTVLTGKPLDPVSLFGQSTGEIYLKTYPPEDKKDPKLKVNPLHNAPGHVEDLLWGLSDSATKFSRVSMSKNFAYLWKEVVPKPEDQAKVRNWMIFIGLIGWAITIAIGEKDVYGYRRRKNHW